MSNLKNAPNVPPTRASEVVEEQMKTLIDKLLEYVWIERGIIEGDRPQVGRVRLMHNPDRMQQILDDEPLHRAVLAWLPTCPTCGGTGEVMYTDIHDGELLTPCPTCGPLRKAAGVK